MLRRIRIFESKKGIKTSKRAADGLAARKEKESVDFQHQTSQRTCPR